MCMFHCALTLLTLDEWRNHTLPCSNFLWNQLWAKMAPNCGRWCDPMNLICLTVRKINLFNKPLSQLIYQNVCFKHKKVKINLLMGLLGKVHYSWSMFSVPFRYGCTVMWFALCLTSNCHSTVSMPFQSTVPDTHWEKLQLRLTSDPIQAVTSGAVLTQFWTLEREATRHTNRVKETEVFTDSIYLLIHPHSWLTYHTVP